MVWTHFSGEMTMWIVFHSPTGLVASTVGRVELVEPACLLRIVAVDVVLDLDLRTGAPGGVFLLGDVIHEAAVAALGDLVVELQFESAVGFLRDDVAAALFGEGEDAVGDLPFVAEPVLLEVAPLGEVLAIEEELPPFGFFGIGQAVGLLGVEDEGSGEKRGEQQQREFHRREIYHAAAPSASPVNAAINGLRRGLTRKSLRLGSEKRPCPPSPLSPSSTGSSHLREMPNPRSNAP
jgi:hypothetical protein